MHAGNLQVAGETEFQICTPNTYTVSEFVFKGNGTLKSINGTDSTGYMARDAENNWYVTIQQAIDSGNSGPFTILRPTGPAPAGWKFVTTEDGMMKLK